MGLTEDDKKRIEEEEYRKVVQRQLKRNQDSGPSDSDSSKEANPSRLKKFAGCLHIFLLLLIPLLGLCYLIYRIFEESFIEFWNTYLEEFWSGNTIQYVLNLVANSTVWSWITTPTGLITCLVLYIVIIIISGIVGPDTDPEIKKEGDKGCALLILIILFPPIIPFLIIIWLLKVIFAPTEND